MFKRNVAIAFALLIASAIITPGSASAQVSSQTIYDNQLENGWQSWSWSSNLNFSNASPAPTGFSDSISVTITSGYGALWLHSANDFNDSSYSSIQFEACGGGVGTAGGQKLQLQATLAGVAQTAYTLQPLPGNGAWTTFTVPLSALGAANAANFDGFWLQDTTGASQPTFYVGAVTLVASDAPPPAVTVSVDATANTHAISPLIYGVAFATTQQLENLNAPINRYGGNATSQYNWELNAANRGSDWYFESIGDTPATPGADGDAYVAASKSAGAQAAITIPTIGWVANLGSGGSRLDSFSVAKYGAQKSVDPYWTDAGNGISKSTGADIANDPTDANVPANVEFEQGWVNHLIQTWGSSQNGGVRYYIMDNEPSIWQQTHRDVHPVGATMSEVEGDIASYGAMVKAADPNALILGPEEWGWSGYFYSGYDQQYGSKHGWSGPLPDQSAHGGMYYLPWMLQQLQATAIQTGVRTLDYFTLHFYPQGGESSNDDSAVTDLLRNRSTRQLWDPNYVSESWIGASGQNGGVVELIPLMKSWVNTYYPGTKIGITEYNWGDEDAMNGATTQADIEGIFGQQGLDLATRWGVPDPAGPAYQAMKIFRNYDGVRSTFGDTSVSDTVPNPDNLSSFAAVRSSDGALTIIVDNKWLSGADTPVTVDIADFNAASSAHVWQLAAPGTSIAQLADESVANGIITFSAAPQTVTLFVVPAAPSIASVSPAVFPAGGLTTTITVNGSGFLPTSIVEWNGAALTTKYVSTAELTATVKEARLTVPGVESVTVANGTQISAASSVTLTAPITISSFTIAPSSIAGGRSAKGNLTFSAPIPPGGQIVKLSSSNPGSATVPAELTIAAGITTRTFSVKTLPVSVAVGVTVTATTNHTPAKSTLTVLAP